VTSVIFRAPVAHWAGLRAGGPGDTWVYDFRWESRSPDVVGAAHCVDIPFGMDMLSAEGVTGALGTDPPQGLADAVHTDWLGLIRDRAVSAPHHGPARETIVYGADASRSIGRAYYLEARIWTEIAGAA
jgi:para-nitrobenzyl esterase